MTDFRPDFLVIGATKSATTWLQRSLQTAPEIHMPDPELHYFSREYHRGADWYRDQFAPGGAALVGEKSNSYLEVPEAADRILRDLPDVRFLVCLRDPVERAYSDYCMLYRRGTVGPDVEAALSPRRGRPNRFLDHSLYGAMLGRFLDRFPRDRFLIERHENTTADPGGCLARAAAFLGIKGPVAPVAERVKDKHAPRVEPRLKALAAPLVPLAIHWRDATWFRLLRAAVAVPPAYPPLPDRLRCELAAYFAPDLADLSGRLGRDFTDWAVAGPGPSRWSARTATLRPAAEQP